MKPMTPQPTFAERILNRESAQEWSQEDFLAACTQIRSFAHRHKEVAIRSLKAMYKKASAAYLVERNSPHCPATYRSGDGDESIEMIILELRCREISAAISEITARPGYQFLQ